ncbi:MAG: hypothetical protein HY827_08460 [Actinobacteria bacterium]|nr:hypothetical protein [Actinomycetota bacterium]
MQAARLTLSRLNMGARAIARDALNGVRPHAGPVTLAFAVSTLYYFLDLRGGDLAAHIYRAELFKSDGLFVWNYNWYGGHYVVSYGVMFAALSSTIGVRLAGAFAYVVGTLLFSMLAREVFPRRGAVAASYVFAVVFSATLVIGQLPYSLSIAIGLGALFAAAHSRPWIGLILAINCALTSPLAALFISFVAFTVWFAAWLPRRGELRPASLTPKRVFAPIDQRPFLIVAVGTLMPATLVSLLFPEGGAQPFHPASFLGALAFTAFFWYFVRDDLRGQTRRLVGIGVALYTVFLLANELVPSPIGANAIRLGMIVFPTVAAAALWPRAGRFALAVIVPLACWQGATAYWAIVTRDASAEPAYFDPVNHFLDKQDPSREQRVEVVFTRNHFEAAYVANRRPIARGWERQLDTKYNSLFYEGRLTAGAYADWLSENDVRWVAVPDVTVDYSGRQEEELIRGGLSYLKPVAKFRDWTVYRVDLPTGGGIEAQFIDRQPSSGFQIRPERFGVSNTRVRWQRFLRPSIGCIKSSDDGYLQIMLPPAPPQAVSSRPPVITINSDFSIRRLVGGEPSCAEGWRVDADGAVQLDRGATAQHGGRA